MPAVSVVVPSFRGGTFLRDAVASVQSQTLEDWELIIVLDGCEDDLSDIERSDPRVRVIKQRNRGESIARNVGIADARSELVAFLDDDDRMLPQQLQAQLGAMRDESTVLCHTQFRLIDGSGATIGEGRSTDSQYRDFLRGDGKILISSAMTRRVLLQEVGGFNPLLPLGADLDFLYRIAREGTVCFLPDVLAEYRFHGANIWLNTGSGGEAYKLILRQHLFVAQARGEGANVRAIRRGMTLVPSGPAAQAIRRAVDARERHDTLKMLGALAVALLLSPRATAKLSLKQARNR